MTLIKVLEYLKEYVFFAFLVVPIFVGFAFGEGLVYDATPLNFYEASTPSFPVGLIFVSLMFLYLLPKLKLDVWHFIALFVFLFYFILSVTTPVIMRSLPVFLGMAVPICNYYIVKNKLLKSRPDIDFFEMLKKIIWTIIWLKFLTDLIFHNSLATDLFLFEDIAIYNFYDYFPFIYTLGLILVISDSIASKKITIFRILTVLICVLVTMSAHSRLYQGVIILAPVFLMFLTLVPLRTKSLIYFFVVIFSLITVIIGVFYYDYFPGDSSLEIRFGHWYGFFSTLTIPDLILPLFNSYRLSLDYGTTHNELLEIYSLFGLGFFLYLKTVADIFSYGRDQDRALSQTIITVLLIGTLIQLNMTNPYVGLLWSTLLATLHYGRRKPEKVKEVVVEGK